MRTASHRAAHALATTLLVSAAAWSATLTGCNDGFIDCDGCCEGDGCGGEPPPSTLRCWDEPAPDDGVLLVLGEVTSEGFVGFAEGQSVTIDYGGQGGQHFYFGARVFGAPEGAVFFARFEGPSDRGTFSRSSSDEICTDGWLELDAYVPLDSGNAGEGVLTVQVGTCPESGCAYDEQARSYVPTELYAEAAIGLVVGSGS
jgi:hypothetical protein